MHHAARVLEDLRSMSSRGRLRRQHVQVSDDQDRIVLVLKLHTVLDAAEQVTEVQPPGGAVAGQDALSRRGGVALTHVDLRSGERRYRDLPTGASADRRERATVCVSRRTRMGAGSLDDPPARMGRVRAREYNLKTMRTPTDVGTSIGVAE